MRNNSDEPPGESANLDNTSAEKQKTPNIGNAKSFYGNKKVNLRWTKSEETKKTRFGPEQKDEPADCESVESGESSSLESSNGSRNETSCKQNRTRMVYKHDNDIFWTSNIYGKKRRTDPTTKTPTKTTNPARQEHAVRCSPRLKCKNIVSNGVDVSPRSNKFCQEGTLNSSGTKTSLSSPIDKISIDRMDTPKGKANHHETTCSVETQTSFSSNSQDSDRRTDSSPMCFVRSSPVVQQGRQQVDSPLTLLNHSDDQAEVHESSDDSEPYEMFNCDSSSHLNSSLRSDSSCSSPSKKTPKKLKEKTLLSYFSKVDNQQTRLSGNSNNKQTTGDVQITKEQQRKKKPASRTQMQFSKSGLSPKAENVRYHFVHEYFYLCLKILKHCILNPLCLLYFVCCISTLFKNFKTFDFDAPGVY